ncbi:MAG: serine hydrolase [Acidobacteria bacterium]|mgnify:CR=1 FL=1|nr:MAG: serine hydrolase [Acidobacteriota bacterium]REK09609.1 MAG: serine hydrolase [Acidobacteriota bacterium]
MKRLPPTRPTVEAWLPILLLAALGSTLLAPPVAAAAADEAGVDWDAFRSGIETAMRQWEVPGLAVSVVSGDEVLFAEGFGTTSLGGDGARAVDEHTLFAAGSTTKAIAAAALGLLVDEGRIGWDTPVQELMPELRFSDPELTARLRVRDLLTHSAGVPNTDVLWYEQEHSLEEILRRMRFVPVDAHAVPRFTYQNVMYAAAGRLTEIVSGEAWPRFVEQRLFAPLGMSRSVATLAATEAMANVAQPHHRVAGEVVRIENASVDPVAAAGSVWSSVHDMSLWLRFLLRGCATEEGEQLLQPETCDELFEPQVLIDREMYPVMRLYDHKWLTYGLGWFQADYRGRALDFHSGSIDGMVALAGLVHREDVGVYVLANLDHAELRHSILLEALDRLDPRPEPSDASQTRDWHREVYELYRPEGEVEAATDESTAAAGDARPPRPLERYVGRYADPIAGEMVVEQRGEMLTLRWGRRECVLAPLDADRFLCAWTKRWRGEMVLEFETGRSGGVGAIDLGGTMLHRQVSDPAAEE